MAECAYHPAWKAESMVDFRASETELNYMVGFLWAELAFAVGAPAANEAVRRALAAAANR